MLQYTLMKHLFYTNSESAWEGLRRAIFNAEKSIYFEMYIFIDDTDESKVILKLLSEKARAGVRVRMILDWFGSYELSKDAIAQLRDAGAELIFFKKIFRRLHRKILIVDEQVGFLGGVNIHGSARRWSDLLIRVEGPIVRSLIWSFRRIYRSSGGKDSAILGYRRKALFGNTRIWMLEHVPFIRKPRLRDNYIETIFKAEHEVIFVTPYFLPHRWMIDLLRGTVARGVKVEVIVPLTTDISFIDRANRRYMSMLSENGVKFYLTPRMNHAKLLLIDRKLALVGSQNIDALSFDFNAEIGVYFNDPKMISDLGAIVNIWKEKTTPFDPEKHITFVDKVFSYMVKFLQPFL